MQLLIESTSRGATLGEDLCQIWTGTTECGRKVLVYVRGVSAVKYKDHKGLKKEIGDDMKIGSVEALEAITPIFDEHGV